MEERQIAKPYEGKKPNWVLVCSYCKKQPHEIYEYKMMGKEYGLTPEEFVKQEEGTYNAKENTFCCTDCFVKNGF